MDFLIQFADYFIHLDKHLHELITTYGTLSYIILFLIVFAETGLVVTPILPGDSLLFAAGALAAMGSFDIYLLTAVFLVAAILGDTVNYWIGSYIGPKVFSLNYRFIKKEHLIKTHQFYEKHGGKTIILARFLPIIRTFAPFVAGVGSMNYSKFILYNIAGGALWVFLFTLLGYFFGNIKFVQDNFSYIVLAIFLIPGLIALFGMITHGRKSKEEKEKTA